MAKRMGPPPEVQAAIKARQAEEAAANYPRPRPPMPEGWNPQLLSLRLARKYPRLSKLAIKWDIYRAEKSTGPGDLSDILPPGVERAQDFPNYYLSNPVHGMQGMHGLDPSMGDRANQMSESFPLGRYDQIKWWIQCFVIDAGIKPKRILELGTGAGNSAFVYAELFPDAEVIGIDIAPPPIRWAKKEAERRGVKNISFYQMDAGDLGYFEDESFDLVHESHMLHEMPTYQIERVISEMLRVCKTGGQLGYFDWAIPENEGDWKHREMMVRVGAEPFMLQYAKANFPEMLERWGCTGIERQIRHSQSASWTAFKGPRTNELLAPELDRIRHN